MCAHLSTFRKKYQSRARGDCELSTLEVFFELADELLSM